MTLPILQAHSDCRACPLGERVEHAGIPGEQWYQMGGRKAVVFIGSYPGVAEEQAGRSFVGAAGQKLRLVYVEAMGFHTLADVWVTNAVRCFPRDRVSLPGNAVTRCAPHLHAELAQIISGYTQVAVVCCGPDAVRAVMGMKQTLGSFQQGSRLPYEGKDVRAFATFNPAILLPGNDPSKLSPITRHLVLIRRWLVEGVLPTLVKPYEGPLVGPDAPDPEGCEDVLSLDIETYGACDGYPSQTVFHPRKSEAFDGSAEVIITGLAWYNRYGERCRKIYRHHHPEDVVRLRGVLARHPGAILGQNIQFDLSYLRRLQGFREVLRPFHTPVWELGAIAYLEDPERPERSLKSLTAILGVAQYTDDEMRLKAGRRFAGPDDPELHRYCALDCEATLVAASELEQSIISRYGDNTCKWGERSKRWFSDLVWLCLTMAENGIEMDRAALETVDRETRSKVAELEADAAFAGLLISGEGSVKSKQDWIEAAFLKYTKDVPVEVAVQVNTGLEMTDGGKISTGAANRQLLLGVIPAGCEDRRVLEAWVAVAGGKVGTKRQVGLAKILSAYTNPLLLTSEQRAKGFTKAGKPRKNQKKPPWSDALVGSRAYPTWYPVPLRGSDSSSEEGGTQQARITSKGPATQTQPKVIEACWKSRHPGGALVSCDASQIELRVGAMWSRDPVMLEIFRAGRNLHAETGSTFAGRVITKADELEYAIGKMANFLRMFRGGAGKLQMSAREDGLEVPMDRVRTFLADDRKRHRDFYAWQDRLIRLAEDQGFLEMRPTGHGRLFLGSLDNQIPTIVNIFVQAFAAALVQSAQVAIEREHQELRSQVLVIANTYDEGIWDSPACEVDPLCERVLRWFRRPPLYVEMLEADLIAEVPLDAEVSIRYNV